MKMIYFFFTANETDYHKKGFALSLVLKGRVFGTHKWPIALKVVYSPGPSCSKAD